MSSPDGYQSNLQLQEGDDLAALEAVLFVSGESIELRALAEVLGWTAFNTRERLQTLAAALVEAGRGIQVQWHGDRVALTTAPRFGGLLQRFYQVERTVRLSEPALETLAVIAMRQPVTRAEIEAIRGVDSTGVLNTLISRELVEVGGRRATAGSPWEYRTTETFLQRFGLAALEQLRADESACEVMSDEVEPPVSPVD